MHTIESAMFFAFFASVDVGDFSLWGILNALCPALVQIHDMPGTQGQAESS